MLVGIVGIGNIGLPLAANLVRAGYSVLGYGKENLDALERAGGIPASSAAEVAARCEVVLHSLPSVDALDDVVHGRSGTLRTLRPGSTVIELSTYPLEVKVRLAQILSDARVNFLDCEMSGTPTMVADRRCLILVSGERELAERMAPLLASVAARCPYLGPLGTSLKMKIVNNMLGAIHLVAAAEAIRLGVRMGIDPAVVAEILTAGASSSAVLVERGARMAERRYSESNGSLESFCKYLTLGERLAKDAGADTPMFDAARPRFLRVLDAGRGCEDCSVVFEALA